MQTQDQRPLRNGVVRNIGELARTSIAGSVERPGVAPTFTSETRYEIKRGGRL